MKVETRGFWAWYLGGHLKVLRYLFNFSWIASPTVEELAGTVGLFFIVLLLGLGCSPFFFSLWLLVPIPFAHGLYREDKKELEEKSKEVKCNSQ